MKTFFLFIMLQTVLLSRPVLLTSPYINIVYETDIRSARLVYYTLTRKDVVSKSIRKRPSFKIDRRLKPNERLSNKDYRLTGYDKGHLAPDASFDYSVSSLNSVYLLSNIVAMDSRVNRYQWARAERRERFLAKHFGLVMVSNIVEYDGYYIDRLPIPVSFTKILEYNNRVECYMFYNDSIKNKKRLQDNVCGE